MTLTQELVDQVNGTIRGTLRIQRIGTLERDDGSVAYLSPEVLEKTAPFYTDLALCDIHDISKQIGTIKRSWYEYPYIYGEYVINDNKKPDYNEVSACYHPHYVPSHGDWVDDLGLVGEPGRSIKYNLELTDSIPSHVSVVPVGRAGSKVAMDSQPEYLRLILDKTTMKVNFIDNPELDARKKADEVIPVEVIESEITGNSDATATVQPVVTEPENLETAAIEVESIEPANRDTATEVSDTRTIEEKVQELVEEKANLSPDLSMGQLVEAMKAIDVKLSSLISGKEADAAPSTSWMADESKVIRRIKNIINYQDTYGRLSHETALADDKEFTKAILAKMGIEADSADMDVNSLLVMAKQLKKDTPLVFKTETKKEADSAPLQTANGLLKINII